MAQVELRKICKRYKDFEAVKEISLTIKDKEFLVLVGPSGCGKSTTLRMIAGLEEISDGDMLIGERRVNDVAPKDRDIAMVFQNYALYPHMSVYDNLSFALKLRKVPKDVIRKKVDEVAQILSLDTLLHRKPKQLSGGQRQRVAMGRAIIRKPSVFLFDEPLSNLDAKLRVQMRVELSKLHARLQTTTVYVTHDQVEAMTLADRIVVMNGGVIQQVGAPLELYNTPINAFVGGFIGSPSMNFLEAAVAYKDDEIILMGDGFKFSASPEHLGDVSGKPEKLLIGIRPQHLVPGYESDAFLEAKVDVVEPMGGETIYHFVLGEKHLVGRTEGGQKATAGDTIKFGIDLTGLHVFTHDGESRLN